LHSEAEWKAAGDRLTDALRQDIREHKAQLLALLTLSPAATAAVRETGT
jgi:hypothetical protein